MALSWDLVTPAVASWHGCDAIVSRRGDWMVLSRREEVSLLERNKYKFSPLSLPEELPALFHGEPLPFNCCTSVISVKSHIPLESKCQDPTAQICQFWLGKKKSPNKNPWDLSPHPNQSACYVCKNVADYPDLTVTKPINSFVL